MVEGQYAAEDLATRRKPVSDNAAEAGANGNGCHARGIEGASANYEGGASCGEGIEQNGRPNAGLHELGLAAPSLRCDRVRIENRRKLNVVISADACTGSLEKAKR
jgi:hypothetical protein